MRTNPQRVRIINRLLGLLLVAVAGTPNEASALTFDFATQPVTVGDRSISIVTGGVTARVSAYHVEFANGTSTIHGPFTTGSVNGHEVFGTGTSGADNPGLGLTTAEDLGQQDTDLPAGGIQPGFDNFPSLANHLNPLPSIQFALFVFDSPIDVSQVIVDDVSNFDRDIWVAGGTSMPNLSLDLVSAFSGFTIINSGDDASDGIFVHSFGPLQNVTVLAVGTALPAAVGDLGPFAQGLPSGSSQFYINALAFEIPVPSCGDGLIASGEGCDDGNTNSGDGCSSSCEVEAGYQCSGQPSVCQVPVFTLYENFASGIIDPALWAGVSVEGFSSAPTGEFIRTAEDGALRLKLVSWGDDTSDSGSTSSRQGLAFKQLGALGGSGSIIGIKLKATILDAVVEDCPANPANGPSSRARAQLIGRFFNDGSGPGGTDETGNIIAGIQLATESDGSNQITPFVLRCNNADCSSSGTPAGVTVGAMTSTWSLNTPLILKLRWDRAHGKFKFLVRDQLTHVGEILVVDYVGTVTDAGPPTNGDFKQIHASNSVENCNGDRKRVVMDAEFDNINVQTMP